MTRMRSTFLATALVALVLTPRLAAAQCVGDCSGSGAVSISNLILGVNISLGASPISACPAFDPDGGGTVTIAELIQAVNNALGGCPATPTATLAEATATATPVDTATATPLATATGTAAATVTDTVAPTATATPPPTATETTVATATAEATATDTSAPTATATTAATATEAAATPTDTVAVDTPTATPEVPTATPTETFTPTATPTSGQSSECGNGVLESGESCATCPADCVIGTCTSPGAPTQAYVVDLVPPLGFQPTTATILLGYDSSVLSLPGVGTATSVRQRIVAPAPVPQAFTPNDLDYAVRVIVSRNIPLATLLTATFDRCGGAPAPGLADIACQVESCAAGGSGVPGCTCTVRLP